MGYCEDDSYVRVDFFKEGGKWYTTESVKWTGDYNDSLYESFKETLRNHLGNARLTEMWAVCLTPYHNYSFPLMVKVKDINKCVNMKMS